MKKKSMLFNIMLVFITLITLTSALLVLNAKKGQFRDEDGRFGIGIHQHNIVRMYYEGEKYRIFASQAARSAVSQVIEAMAESGGNYYPLVSCKKNDFIIWRTHEDPYCMPSEYLLADSFGFYFGNIMARYLDNYPFASLRPDFITLNLHDILIEKSRSSFNFSGFARKPAVLRWPDESITYSFYPSFKDVIVDYDLFGTYNKFVGLADTAYKSVIECLEAGSDDVHDADDLVTCTDAARALHRHNNQPVMDSSEDLGKQLFFKFKVKDEYGGRQFDVKFGYIIKDEVIPPLLHNILINKRESLITISWEKSFASDVIAYELYASNASITTLEGLQPLGTFDAAQIIPFFGYYSEDSLTQGKFFRRSIGTTEAAHPGYIYSVGATPGQHCFAIVPVDRDGYKAEEFEPNKCITIS